MTKMLYNEKTTFETKNTEIIKISYLILYNEGSGGLVPYERTDGQVDLQADTLNYRNRFVDQKWPLSLLDLAFKQETISHQGGRNWNGGE